MACYPVSRSIESSPSNKESGFTLIEILVAISLLALIAAVSFFAFNGNKSKGQVLFSAMTSIAHATARYQLDTSCIPLHPDMLFNSTLASSTDNSCGVDLTATWDGPYLKAVQVDGNGDIALPQIGALTTLGIGPAPTPIVGGGSNQYAVIAKNVPGAVIREAMRACNGGANSATSSGVCQSTTVAGGGTGNMSYVFSTNN